MKTLKLYTLLFCSAFAANNTMTLSNDNHENSFATMEDNFYDEDENPFAAMGDVFGKAADFDVEDFATKRFKVASNDEERAVIEEQLRDLNKNFPPKKKRMEDENPFAAIGDVFGCWDEDDISSEAKFETNPNAEERAVIEDDFYNEDENPFAAMGDVFGCWDEDENPFAAIGDVFGCWDEDDISSEAKSETEPNAEKLEVIEDNFYNSVIVAIYQHAINSIKRLCSWYRD